MSVEDLTALVDSVVESHAEELWKLSRFLWEHPELALQEVKAHDALCEFLEQRGFEVRRNYVLDTAFRAEFVAPGGADGDSDKLVARRFRAAGDAGVEFTDADLSSMEPCGASTDVGNVSYEVPTIHPMFGIRTDGMNHTPAFAEASNSAEAQAPTLRTAKTLALTALDLFTDPALVSQAKAEFAEWKKARLQQRGGKNQSP
ncbi:hypothetical protein V5799_028980 [Amblyomma americanum]|uniref:Amidohydrolase n=1 Tax=Amblyomma americanum TaxID=6943 RepID=A0AAQ4ESU1_AMBAM